jgi:hypothetical protein
MNTLLSGESGVASNGGLSTHTALTSTWDKTFIRPRSVPATITAPRYEDASPGSDNTAVGHGVRPRPHYAYERAFSEQPESSIDVGDEKEDEDEPSQKVPVHDQRTVLITNLSERTTHKDLVGIVRGGRLLDIFLRNDRTATISFVEGAADFLAYAKRKDIYLHTKRVSNDGLLLQSS